MAIQINPEIEGQLKQAAQEMGESTDNLVRKVLLTYLEDRDDAMRTAERLKKPGQRISLEEIGRKYGLVN